MKRTQTVVLLLAVGLSLAPVAAAPITFNEVTNGLSGTMIFADASLDGALVNAASGDQILIGEGAYEGLTAIATVDLEDPVWSWHGWIIEGDLPPIPTEPEAIP